MLHKCCTSTLRCFYGCFVCGLWLWKWRRGVWFQALRRPNAAGTKGPEKSLCSSQISHSLTDQSVRPVKTCTTIIIIITVREDETEWCALYERGITHLSHATVADTAGGQAKMEILFFYLFGEIKKGKLLENRWHRNVVLSEARRLPSCCPARCWQRCDSLSPGMIT